jgi:DNA-binding response OmpR family regulator
MLWFCVDFESGRDHSPWQDCAMARVVLVVEDDPDVRTMLRLLLEDDEYAVVEAADGDVALEQFARSPADLVVLDLRLPRLSGLDVCRQIRSTSRVPIIVVSAQVDSHDVVAALELGADDYVTKPFVPRELLARIHALLRRASSLNDDDSLSWKFGSVEIRPREGVVSKGGVPVELTKTEYMLLVDLAQNSGQVMSRESLLTRVWGYDFLGDVRVVDSHISRLRNKIEDDPSQPDLIQTVRGFGYKLATR